VLGLGNVLMGDDGFGPTVVDAIHREYEVDDDVEIVDLGTPGLDLLPWLADAERVIIVDTVRSDAAPGTLQLYSKRDLLKNGPGLRIGPHDPGVLETILTLEFAGRAPRDVILVGVVPKRIGMGLGLSPAIARAVPGAVLIVERILQSAGRSLRPRLTGASVPSAWWLGAAR
jgi:hydrogenase maturation protease